MAWQGGSQFYQSPSGRSQRRWQEEQQFGTYVHSRYSSPQVPQQDGFQQQQQQVYDEYYTQASAGYCDARGSHRAEAAVPGYAAHEAWTSGQQDVAAGHQPAQQQGEYAYAQNWDAGRQVESGGEFAEVARDVPEAVAEVPEVAGDVPKVAGDVPEVAADVPAESVEPVAFHGIGKHEAVPPPIETPEKPPPEPAPATVAELEIEMQEFKEKESNFKVSYTEWKTSIEEYRQRYAGNPSLWQYEEEWKDYEEQVAEKWCILQKEKKDILARLKKAKAAEQPVPEPDDMFIQTQRELEQIKARMMQTEEFGNLQGSLEKLENLMKTLVKTSKPQAPLPEEVEEEEEFDIESSALDALVTQVKSGQHRQAAQAGQSNNGAHGRDTWDQDHDRYGNRWNQRNQRGYYSSDSRLQNIFESENINPYSTKGRFQVEDIDLFPERSTDESRLYMGSRVKMFFDQSTEQDVKAIERERKYLQKECKPHDKHSDEHGLESKEGSPKKRKMGEEGDEVESMAGKKGRMEKPPSLMGLQFESSQRGMGKTSKSSYHQEEKDAPTFYTGVVNRKREGSPESSKPKQFSQTNKYPQRYGGYSQSVEQSGQRQFKRRKLADGTELVDAESGECPVPECKGEKFNSPDEMRAHWRKMHERRDVYTYYCSKCVWDASQKYQLKGHLKKAHYMDGPALNIALDECHRALDEEKPPLIDPGNMRLKKDPYWKRQERWQKTRNETQGEGRAPEHGSASQGKGDAKKSKSLDYTCPVPACYGKSFPLSQDIEQHWETVHKKQNKKTLVYLCNVCSVKIADKSDLENHYNATHYLVGHALSVHVERSRQIEYEASHAEYIDPGKYTLAELLEVGQKSKTDGQQSTRVEDKRDSSAVIEYIDPTCRQCPVLACQGELFQTPNDFQNHWHSVHEKEHKPKIFSCTVCNIKFGSKQLEIHYKKFHGYSGNALKYHLNKSESMAQQGNKAYIEPGKFRLWQPGMKKPGTEKEDAAREKNQASGSSKSTSNESSNATPSKSAPAEKSKPATPVDPNRIDPDLCKCLVPQCQGAKFNTAKEMEQHWNKVHIPHPIVTKVYICVSCSAKLNSKQELEQHYRGKHFYGGRAIHYYMNSAPVKEISQTSGYISPGKFYLGEPGCNKQVVETVQSNRSSAPAKVQNDKTVENKSTTEKITNDVQVEYVDPLNGRCPVSACVGKVFKTVEILQNHWKEMHVNVEPVRKHVYLCSNTHCTEKYDSKTALAAHYQRTHGYSGIGLQNALKYCASEMVFEPSSTTYVNPGKYRLGEPGCSKKAQQKVQETAPQKEVKKEETKVQQSSPPVAKTDTSEDVIYVDPEKRQCPVSGCCGSQFPSVSETVEHWKNMHQKPDGTEKLLYKCNVCPFRVSGRNYLEIHYKNKHFFGGDNLSNNMKRSQFVTLSGKIITYIDPGRYRLKVQEGGSTTECGATAKPTTVAETTTTTKTTTKTSQGTPTNSAPKNTVSTAQSPNTTKVVGEDDIEYIDPLGGTCPVSACKGKIFKTVEIFQNHWKEVHEMAPPTKTQVYLCSNRSCVGKFESKTTLSSHLQKSHMYSGRALQNALQFCAVGTVVTQPNNAKYVNPGKYRLGEPGCSRKVQQKKVEEPKPTAQIDQKKDEMNKKENETDVLYVDPQKMQCPVAACHGKKFSSVTEFTQHWKAVHETIDAKEEPRYRCNVCNYEVAGRPNLETHYKNKHFFGGYSLTNNMNRSKMVSYTGPNVNYINPGRYRMKQPETQVNATTAETKSPVSVEQSGSTANKSTASANQPNVNTAPVAKSTSTTKTTTKEFTFVDPATCQCPVQQCEGKKFTSVKMFEEHWNEVHEKKDAQKENKTKQISSKPDAPKGDLVYICETCTYRNGFKIRNELEDHYKRRHLYSGTALTAIMEKSKLEPRNIERTSQKYIDPGQYRWTKQDNKSSDDISGENKPADTKVSDSKPAVDKTPEIIYVDPSKCICPVPQCKGKVFKTSGSMRDHWRGLHEAIQKKQYICCCCSSKQPSEAAIEAHYKGKHFFTGKGLEMQLKNTQLITFENKNIIDPGKYRLLAQGEKLPQEKTSDTPADMQKSQATVDTKVSGTVTNSEPVQSAKAEESNKTTTPSSQPGTPAKGQQKPTVYTCPVPQCNKVAFSSFTGLEDHWKKVHVEQVTTLYLCAAMNCTSKFTNMQELNIHLRSRHYFSGRALEHQMKVVKSQQVKDLSGYIDPGQHKLNKDEVSSSPVNRESENHTAQVAASSTNNKQDSTEDIVPLSTKVCPVKDCPLKDYIENDIRYHWKKYHVPQERFYLCPDCDLLQSEKILIKQHYINKHRTNPNSKIPQNVENPSTRLFYNQFYVNPGKLQLEKEEVLNQEPPNLQYLPVSQATCPVPACRDPKFNTAQEFRIHWKICHLPLYRNYACNVTPCPATFPSLIMVKRHYEIIHKVATARIENLIGQANIIEKINSKFVDPGIYRVPAMGFPYPSSSPSTTSATSTPTGTPAKQTLAASSPKTPVSGSLSFHDFLDNWPKKIEKSLILIRGPPGVGKTRLARYIKEQKINIGGMPAKILSVESKKELKMKSSVSIPMEETVTIEYLLSRFKLEILKKSTVLLIVDAIFEVVGQMESFIKFAESNNFKVYLIELMENVKTCFKRNVHFRTQMEIEKIISQWQSAPSDIKRLDVTGLLEELKAEESNSICKPAAAANVVHVDIRSCHQCPVPGCKQIFWNKNVDGMEHWAQKHIPYVTYCFCSECYFVCVGQKNMATHFYEDHQLEGADFNKKIPNLHSCRVRDVSNYIDPGNLRIQELDQDTADVTVYNVPKFIPCPVKECRGQMCPGIQAFRLHWQINHLPVAQYYDCSECTFKTTQAQVLKEHYMSGFHNKNPGNAVTALRKSATFEQRNQSFTNPGRHQLLWRKVFASLK